MTLLLNETHESSGRATLWSSSASLRRLSRRKVRERNEEASITDDASKVRIGQDCSQSNAPCQYFQPVDFVREQPHLIRDIAPIWAKFGNSQIRHPHGVSNSNSNSNSNSMTSSKQGNIGETKKHMQPYGIGGEMAPEPLHDAENQATMDEVCNHFYSVSKRVDMRVVSCSMTGEENFDEYSYDQDWFGSEKMPTKSSKSHEKNKMDIKEGSEISSSDTYCQATTTKVRKEKEYVSTHLPRSFTFKHIHMTGENAIEASLMTLQDLQEEGGGTTRFETTPMSFTQKKGHSFRFTEHMIYIEEVQRDHRRRHYDDEVLSSSYLDGFQRRGHTIVAMVRNPISRFLSVAALAMNTHDMMLAGLCEVALNTNRETLRCIISQLEDGMYMIESLPMLTDLYCSSQNHDVEYSIYDYEASFEHIVELLGVQNRNTFFKRESEKEKEEPAATNEILHEFSRKDIDYDMMRRICKLYAWDVVMMEFLGFGVLECRFS